VKANQGQGDGTESGEEADSQPWPPLTL